MDLHRFLKLCNGLQGFAKILKQTDHLGKPSRDMRPLLINLHWKFSGGYARPASNLIC